MNVVRTFCDVCLQTYELRLTETTDGLLLKQLVPEGVFCRCPRQCGGSICLVNDEKRLEMMGRDGMAPPITLTAKELFQAVNGLGLPDEIPKHAIVIDSLLRANRVEEVLLEEHNGRIYLHEMKLSNGTTIHLTAGAKGASVLKVTELRRT